MEAFSLLKYWRGGGFTIPAGAPADSAANSRSTTTIVNAVAEDTDSVVTDDNDDGPYFDMEFTVPDDEDKQVAEEYIDHDNSTNGGENGEEEPDVEVREGESVFNFTVSSGSSSNLTDPNLSLSPSDDLFFNGRLVPIDPSSAPFGSSELNSKSQFSVSLLKTATKFRVFALGLKKSKSGSNDKTEQKDRKTEYTQPAGEDDGKKEEIKQQQHKRLTVKLKLEEVMMMSLFTRDTSAKNSSSKKPPEKQSSEELGSGERRFSKDAMNKYLNKVKPIYVGVSRKYGDKLKFSGPLGAPKSDPPISTAEKKQSEPESPLVAVAESNLKHGNLPAGVRVVCKHLGKSRSASSVVTATKRGERRDDSLLQQEDGIQSAILHCKKSFNASRDTNIK